MDDNNKQKPGILVRVYDAIMIEFSYAPQWKGTRFERYVKGLFDERLFECVHQTPRFTKSTKKFDERSLAPDFVFRYMPSGELFAIEAKYRSRLDENGMLPTCKPYQFERYNQFEIDTGIPVYLVIGLGGNSYRPRRMFLIPLRDLKYASLNQHQLDRFEHNPEIKFYLKYNELF
jgi:hypothetical protein